MGSERGTVRIGYVRALLDYLRGQGIDAQTVFDASLLARLDDAALNERLPVAHWGRLLERAVMHTGDPDLPLRVAEELTPRHWGVFAYAAMTCQTLAQVVLILERYERLIDEVNDSRLHLLGDRAALEWIPRLTQPSPAFMQLSLASWALFARRYTGRADLVADVDFTFPAPADTAHYHRLFGGEVRFAQGATRLVFPLHYLQLPITHHDAESHQVLLSQAQRQISALDADQEELPRLRQLIRRHLSSGGVTLEGLARAQGLSARALQYQLENSGTTYRELLDETRTELARAYLCDPDMSLVDVAFLLGFSEQSPFTKAFRRWTGETPGEFRRKHVRREPPG